MYELKSKKIAILGAGVCGIYQRLIFYQRIYFNSNSFSQGLTTAERLYETFGNDLDLTIIGDQFDVDTTSDGAGGLFRYDNLNIYEY